MRYDRFILTARRLGMAACAAVTICCSVATRAAAQDAVAPPPPPAAPAGVAAEASSFQPPDFFGAVPADDPETRISNLENALQQQQDMMSSMQKQLDAYNVIPNQPGERYRVGSRLNMTPVWNNGLEFRTPNKDFYFHVGGRTQWDNTYMGSSAQGPALVNTSANSSQLQDATDFRRARLRMEGSMYETIDFCMEYNFVNVATMQDPTSGAPQVPGGGIGSAGANANILQNRTNGVVQPVDLWWNVRAVPIFGNIQFGNMKEPFNLERLESSRYLDFMERNYSGDAFVSPSANGFAPGVMSWNWSQNRRATYAVGVFKNVTNGYAFNIGDGNNEVAGRLTYLPYYDDANNGRNFVHVGLGGCHRAIDNELIRYRSRGDLRNGPDALLTAWADTNFIGGTSQDIINPELMIQRGPLFIQSEYTGNYTQNAVIFPAAPAGTNFNNGLPANGSPQSVAGARHIDSLYYYGGYCQVMYFLTGENRVYDYQKGLVGRVVPSENAFWVKGRNGRFWGSGAWQVGYRINYLDLNNQGVDGGRLVGHTLGLNWFLNPNSKVQFNVDYMDRTARNATANTIAPPSAGTGTIGDIYGFGVRFACDF